MIAQSRRFGLLQFSRLTAYGLPFTFALGAMVGRAVLLRTSRAGAIVGVTPCMAADRLVDEAHSETS